jgi:stress-induced morphogen
LERAEKLSPGRLVVNAFCRVEDSRYLPRVTLIRDQVTARIQAAIPDATVEVIDLTGTDNHLEARVISPSFVGKSLIERHKMIYASVKEWIDDDTVHALAIKAWTPEEGP